VQDSPADDEMKDFVRDIDFDDDFTVSDDVQVYCTCIFHDVRIRFISTDNSYWFLV